ncbi:MAG: MarR family transcriptional regulator [Eubacteriaceae bacterium]|nr:MarR family transcriptional regulator [Eubacteriaceae bacterium]
MSDRAELSKNLLMLLPAMFKKLMKEMPEMEIPKQQLGLLFRIHEENGRTMSTYSDKMCIPKSNLTILADKLIQEGLIVRENDSEDRRVVNLKITEKGQEFVDLHMNIVKSELLKRFEVLDDDDVTKLNTLIIEMKNIFDKI